jgi:RsiW-degrading membrane proteinase PrsW (M82 family)
MTDPAATTETALVTDYSASAGKSATAPASAPVDIAAHAMATTQPGLLVPSRRNAARGWGIAGIIVVAILAVAVLVYLIAGLGPDAFALGGIMALVPLAIVFFGVRWIDRWEPEPRLAVIFAFLWGAAAAVIIALVVDYRVSNWVNSSNGPGPNGYDFFGATVQSPIVEEGAKGLGVFLIFLVARRFFDSPVDGVVYAAWVAGGFAFTENILYFGGQLLDVGGFDGSVFQIFLIRGIMSPFAHIMFTTCTGLAIGFAARRGYGVLGGFGFFLLGLVPAILLHSLWNAALYFVSDFYGYYAIVPALPDRRDNRDPPAPPGGQGDSRPTRRIRGGWLVQPQRGARAVNPAGSTRRDGLGEPQRQGQGNEALHPGCHEARLRPPAHHHRT